MKKLRSKIILTAVLAVLLLTSIFVVNMVAAPTYNKITYMHNGTSYSVIVENGESVTLPTPEAKVGGTVYGWFDKLGNFYDCGEAFTPTKNTVLYCAEGAEISLSGSLPLSFSKGYSYVKLNSSITLNNTINMPNGIFYIDLNGNNFSLNTDGDGFVGEDFGLVLANSSSKKSTLTHTAAGELAFSLNSFAVLSPTKSANYLSFVVGENVALKENMNLISVNTDISAFESALRIDLFGELESGKIIRGNGLNNAIFEIYDGSTLTTSCEYFFEDSRTTAKTAATLIVNGGHLNNAKSTSYAKDTSLFKALVYGGTFTADTSKFFTLGNYISTYDTVTGIYTFSKCSHAGSLIEHAPDCTSDVTLKHFCKYCETVFEKRYISGVGHSYSPKLTQDIVNTPEETIAGCYTLTCTKCGHTTSEYTYPDPATTYTTVGFIKDGKEVYMRFPSTDLFSFDGTKILSFSADALFYDTVDSKGEKKTVYIQQTSVFHVDIPLGTTEIFGNTFTYNGVETPTGVFLRNDHLKSVSFPVSIKNINKYAFSSMPNLETLYGLEYITGTIDKGAFMQADGSKLYIENMVLNAQYIRQDAFKNATMKTLTFGSSVKEFNQGAFALAAGVTSPLKEVFVEGNTLADKTVQEAFAGLRKGYSSGHQFDGLRIVYQNHNYVKEDVLSTCVELGYDLLTCDRCGFVEKSNYKTEYAPHVYIPHNKTATCQTLGYEGEICTVCEYIHVINDIYYDKKVHTYTYNEVKVPVHEGSSVCVDAYYTLGQCKCGAIEADILANRSEIHLPAAGADHNWRITVIVQETCGTSGYAKYECRQRDCGQIIYQIIKPSGGHHWEETVTTPATCSSGDIGYMTCSGCGDRKEYTNPTLNPQAHVKKAGDKGFVVTEPTEIHTGSKVFFCALCNQEFYEEIEPTGRIDDGSFTIVGIRFKGGAIGIILAVLFVLGALLVAGLIIFALVMTIFFTFTKKKNKSKGYNYGFTGNDTKKGPVQATRTVAEQLAEINLASDELPPDVEIGENGLVDEEAAFTAYMDAISGFDATRELNVEEEKADEVNPDLAWQAYVDALNKDYEETMELSLRAEETKKQSFDEMDETDSFDLGEGQLTDLDLQDGE